MLEMVQLKLTAAVMARPSTHTSMDPNKLMCIYLSEGQISINAEVPQTRVQSLPGDEPQNGCTKRMKESKQHAGD